LKLMLALCALYLYKTEERIGKPCSVIHICIAVRVHCYYVLYQSTFLALSTNVGVSRRQMNLGDTAKAQKQINNICILTCSLHICGSPVQKSNVHFRLVVCRLLKWLPNQ
jgi:hypothetical protein